MIIIGIILIILAIIDFYCIYKTDTVYNTDFANLVSIICFVFAIISIGCAMGLISSGINNLKSKEKEIKNVEYYNIKSTVIIEDNIPIDTIYTIYYKKK